MASNKRILFFGVTGVDKKEVLSNLQRRVTKYGIRNEIGQANFERDYLFNRGQGGLDWYSFLDESYQKQRERWHRSWKKFAQERLKSSDDLYVGMHGCVVRGHYGVRCILEPQVVVKDVKPDIIVTLLDDIYEMWWRTEERAGGEDYRGRPTLEQLLFARRTELIVADQVAHSGLSPIPHLMISVSHPCETLVRRIYSSAPKVVYLAFPISAPRDLLKEGNDSGVLEINAFLEAAYQRQQKEPNLVLICPLGIDELPLVQSMKDSQKDIGKVCFDRKLRWDMSKVWPENCLSSQKANPCRIPREQVESAAGTIKTDVGWRDYRLVDQADYLVAFNPKFKNRDSLSRSVFQEIHYASANAKPVYVIQEEKHDPDGLFDKQFPSPGTMQASAASQMVIRKKSADDAFDAILS